MSRMHLRRVGRFALIALTVQIAAGASASPCAFMDHAVADLGASPSGAMAGMPMPDDGNSEHNREDCTEQQTVPACQAGSACAVLAIPAVSATLPASPGASPLPFTAPVTLFSALTAPDQPPPRA